MNMVKESLSPIPMQLDGTVELLNKDMQKHNSTLANATTTVKGLLSPIPKP